MLGADATEARNGSPTQPPSPPARTAYRALVNISAQHIDDARSGQRLRLASGMSVSAEVLLGTRTVLEYLLSPLQRTAVEAARER